MGSPHHSDLDRWDAAQSDGTVRPSLTLDYIIPYPPGEVMRGNKHRVPEQHHGGNTATCASNYDHTRGNVVNGLGIDLFQVVGERHVLVGMRSSRNWSMHKLSDQRSLCSAL